MIAEAKFSSYLTPDIASKTMSDMASNFPNSDLPNAMSMIVFDGMSVAKKLTKFKSTRRQVWRQKSMTDMSISYFSIDFFIALSAFF